MRTSRETDFLNYRIGIMGSTYPGQRPQCPSLSPHFLWTNSINISNTLEFSIFGLIKKKHPTDQITMTHVISWGTITL